MSASTTRRALVAAALLIGLPLVAGCGNGLRTTPIENLAPTVRITEAPRDTNAVCTGELGESCYALTVSWSGFDPDGRVDHYEYAIDPPSAADADTVWQTTRVNQVHVDFSARVELPRSGPEPPRFREYHVFVVRAVDDRGRRGPPDFRAFFASTEAPWVLVTDPTPDAFSAARLSSAVRIRWRGGDEDGVTTQRPVRYKYLVITIGSDPSIADVAHDPDVLRRRFAPDFAGWQSLSGGASFVDLDHLTPERDYLFAIVAFDEAGAYSPVFSFNTNILRFRVSLSASLGPVITASSDLFQYTWSGAYCATPACELGIEIPAGKRFFVSWSGQPAPAVTVVAYRWAIDIADLTDETPRTDEPTDLAHWSQRSARAPLVALGPYPASFAGTDHRLYLEAEDNRGFKGLAVVRFRVIAADFGRNTVLVLKDTRLRPDALDRATGCVARPTGFWPSQAELDTFLFARGGFPWRCYPTGARSPAGLFARWSVDTLGTRPRTGDPTLRLSQLSRYGHVIWIVDSKSAAYNNLHLNEQVTALRFACQAGNFNVLRAYLSLGGRVWLVGGGIGLASTIDRNDLVNDIGGPTFDTDRRELVPGTLMYDVVGWQSSFRSTGLQATAQKFTGRHALGPEPGLDYTAYLAELPARLDLKTAATDPIATEAPIRTRTSDFYQSVAPFEFLESGDRITVPVDDTTEVAVLDTLMEVLGGGVTRDERHATMTYYHGPLVPQGLLFSGFDVWLYQRNQCQAMVDFVMRRVWGLTPRASTAGVSQTGAAAPPRPAAAPPSRRGSRM